MEAEGSGGLRSQRAWKITSHGYVQTRSLVLGVWLKVARIWQGGGRAAPGDSHHVSVGVGFSRTLPVLRSSSCGLSLGWLSW